MAREPRLTSLASHPRAGAAIRRAKAWGGIAGFAIAALASLLNGLPLPAVLLRALEGGVLVYLLTWAAAVAIWKRVLLGQAKVAVDRAKARATRNAEDREATA